MPLASGARLGAYEVRSLLGRGGMGEVYRARDTRLQRDVAIKILPASFAADPQRLQRFEQEALAAARLNHPNILSVYDVGSTGECPYVVSELLEGATLRGTLTGGALPPRKAIDYAIQMANGLAAAHERGIVHRDLKPENIFITSDGRVKILDFGLAKLAEAASEEAANRPTLANDTEPGTILGTVGYMSPEQVRGQKVDARTDVFSLGAVLYEMVSGTRAFAGSTPADTISAILRADPPEITTERSGISPALDRVIRYCLEKVPDQRFQSARDVSLALQAMSGAQPGVATTVPLRRRAWRRVAFVALVAMVMGTVGFLAGRDTVRPSVPTFQRLTFRRGTVTSARFAPDGRTVLYAAAWEGAPLQVFSTRPENPESRELTGGPTDLLGVSPNAEVALLLDRRRSEPWVSTGTLARVPLDGGTPRPILDGVQWADWSPAGELAIVRDVAGESRLESPPGHVVFRSVAYISHPRFSPSGDAIGLIDHIARAGDEGIVRIVRRDGSEIASSARWISAWGLAWASEDEVWFSGTRVGASRAIYGMTRAGRERLVARLAGMAVLHDVSKDGRAIVGREDQRLGIIARAPDEPRDRDLSWFDFSALRDVSADGRMLLFDETGDAGGASYSTWVRSADGAPAVHLADGAGFCFVGGPEQVLAMDVHAPVQRFTILPTGAGEAQVLPPDRMTLQWAGCFPDGRRILTAGGLPGQMTRLYVENVSEGKPRPFTEGGVTLVPYVNSISPDGTRVFARGRDGAFAVYRVDGGPVQRLNGLQRQFVPFGWTSDGSGLYVYTPGEMPSVVSAFDLATGALKKVGEYQVPDPAGVQFIRAPYLRQGGRSYAFSYMRILSDLYLVDGLK